MSERKHTESYLATLEAVITLLLENQKLISKKHNPELVEMFINKFGGSERTANRYIKAAKAEIRKIGRDKNEKLKMRALQDREYLFMKAKQKKDYKFALEVAKDRDKLSGLYTETIEHKGEVNQKIIFVENLDE